MNYFRHTILILTFFGGAAFVSVSEAQIQLTPVKVFDFATTSFKVDMARARIYASLSSSSLIAIIDTPSFDVETMLDVGGQPAGMAISPDGTKLYVSLLSDPKIAVVSLDTLTVLPSLPTPDSYWQLEAGLGDRLYASTNFTSGSSLVQLDATTGMQQATLANLDGSAYIQMSSDQTQLYYALDGSPGTLERFDVSNPTAVLEQSVSSNASAITLSNDGLTLADGIALRAANDLSNILETYGSFSIYGTPIFRPDDQLLFQYDPTDDQINVFRTDDAQQTAAIYLYAGYLNSGSYTSVLSFDSTGRYLVYAANNNTPVYDLFADQTLTVSATKGEPISYYAPIFIAGANVTAIGLPAGLSFDPATKLISGTPTVDGSFSVTINGSDATHSGAVNLTLLVYPNSRQLNISTRLEVQTGDDVLIAGFIITGSYAKPVAVRAIGPSLAVNGVPLDGRLMDTTLELHDSTGAIIATNDNWDTDDQSYVLDNYGIQPSDFREAALYRVLAPGAYTMIVRGANNANGIGLAEVYDLNSEIETTPVGGSRLANISTRGRIETGDNVMIGGVIVDGEENTPLLLRAIGPSLSEQGVTDFLANPQMTLYDSQGTTVASNDNWRDTQETEIKATGLAPTKNFESAISISLEPGAYTAVVSGVNGGTGVGLVEAYNLP